MTPLEQKLHQSNLNAMSRQIETTISEAAAKNLSVSATIEWLADMELETRRGRAIERRFKCSSRRAIHHVQGHASMRSSEFPAPTLRPVAPC